MSTIEENAPIWRRRRHNAEFKTKTVQECMQPGVSIATIILHHRLNANLLRRWVAKQETENGTPGDRELMGVPQGEFIPLRIGEPTTAIPDIQIEIRHGATTISLRWPGSAATQRVQWLQEWLH